MIGRGEVGCGLVYLKAGENFDDTRYDLAHTVCYCCGSPLLGQQLTASVVQRITASSRQRTTHQQQLNS